MLKVKVPGKVSKFLKCSVCALSLILGIGQFSDVYGSDSGSGSRNRARSSSSSNRAQASGAARSAANAASRMSGGGGSSSSSASNNGEESDSENYPFEKASGNIAEDQVCGIRIKEEKSILLGTDHTFSELNQKNEGDFDDVNFFKKYPNLLSVEFSGIELTDEALQNLQTFLPENLKMLIIDSCKISKKGYELLAKLIESHPDMVSVRVRMYSAKANQSEIIINSLAELKNLKYLGLGFGKISEKSLGALGEYIGSLNELRDISLSWMNTDEDGDSEDDSEEKENRNTNGYDKFISGFSMIASDLTGIEFAFIEFPEKAAKDLFTELDKCRSVSKLTLWIGNMNKYGRVATNDCASKFGDALTNMKQLANLDISCMGLDTNFLKVFADSYTSNDALTALNISGNKIEKESAAALGESLKDATNLQILLANDCEMEDQAVGDLFKNLGNAALKCVCLNNNKLKDGVKQIPIKNMADLQGIDLSGNEMGKEEIEYLSENTPDNLKIVRCDNNKGLKSMSRAELTELIDKLEQKNMEGQTVGFMGI